MTENISGLIKQVDECIVSAYNKGNKDGRKEVDDVLNKIRAEIEEMDEGIPNYYNDKPLFKAKVLRIIDKHRAESGE